MTKSIFLIASACVLPALAVPAFAQTPPASRTATGISDIVVTATRREERLQEVPIAVSAITGDDLASQQQVDISSLGRTVPNLNIAPFTGDPTNATVALRGQVAADNLPNIDPAVGIYLDGVYLARSSGANLNLIDVERVEVMRGPQGTLFGRNTIGGAINIIPARPTHEFEGWVEGSYGNYDAWRFTGMLNTPISDNLAARFVAQHSERDGFARSSLTGNELNAENLDYYRASISADLGNWTALLAGDYTKFTNNGQWTTLAGLTPGGIAFVDRASGGTDDLRNYLGHTKNPASNAHGPFTSEGYGGSFTLTGDLTDAITLKSITAYRKTKRDNNNNDLDGTPYFMLQQMSDQMRQKQWSQEVQLFGQALDNRLDWIVGGYYFWEKGFHQTQSRFFYIESPTGTQNITEADDVVNISKSLFGQVTFNFTDELSLTAGVRHVWDTRKIALANRTLRVADGVIGGVIGCGLPALATAPDCRYRVPDAKFDYTPFTVGLNYQPNDDVLLYAKFSRGFRSGGFNVRASTEQAMVPFAPEKVDSVEVGAKLDVGDVLRFNAAAYHSRFSDIQFTTVRAFMDGDVTRTYSIVENAGKAKVTGFELESIAQLGQLRLTGSLGVLGAKYTELLPGVTGITLASPFQLTPEVTWSVGADYEIEAAFGTINLHADYSYKGDIAFAPNARSVAFNMQPSYHLLNGVISVKLNDPRFDISIWGRNLTNEKYYTRILDQSAIGFSTGMPGDPRTYGVTARYSF